MPQPKPQNIAKVYEPHPAEERWWKAWEEANLFSAPEDPQGKKGFSIVIPPPNVTGSLHMGHALNNTLQDILVRFHRMEGDATLWVFGMDHAGIATQNVVERQLESEGQDRHDLGREAFVEKVWKWKEESGGTIRHQLKKLGCSLDYNNERFTMDEGLSKAVKEVFVRLYEEGKIYRAERLINWCPRCHTALSDLEVEHEEINGHLWHIRYPMEGNPSEGIVVATTRPETLLGDTAVAVHPEDERYVQLVGKKVLLPFVDRAIPIITDLHVDKEFGSGAVKITPAHDFNDFEIGNRHNLERVNVLTEDGRMNDEAGPFQGQDRYECRHNVVHELENQGTLVSIEDYKTSIGHCYRCKTVVEPYLSMQWFVRTGDLAKEALKAVQEDRTRIVPEQWENTYFRWMEEIKDWCISRQIWWGHRIPVWYCDRCGGEKGTEKGIIVSREEPSSCPHCGGKDLKQDSDVLDTWFSSALWPFSTLGWPSETKRLEGYYPTSVLITGFDIIFFWVARMMMMGLHFTRKVPFYHVYIHALVRDAEGKKMSKSKGNVLDPLDEMEKYGTDAFRFTLAALAAQGRDIKLSEERILGYRNFCNKIWNASRLVFSNVLENADLDLIQKVETNSEKIPAKHPISRWVLFELSQAVSKVRKGIEEYRFNDAAHEVYQFFWSVYCDWFLELIKTTQKSEDPQELELKGEFATVAVYVLDQALRLMHPFIPFITEEVWQKISPRDGKFLATATFPRPLDSKILDQFSRQHENVDAAIAVVEKVRHIRMEAGIPLNKDLGKWSLYSSDEGVLHKILEVMHFSLNLMKSHIPSLNDLELKKEKGIARGVTRYRDVVVLVDLKGIVDLEKERARQEKDLIKIQKGLESTKKVLANPNFVKNAPEELVKETKEKLENYEKKKQEMEEAIQLL